MNAPNPGSDAAIDMGCTCPVLDNGHGKGSGPFWITGGCSVHDPKPKATRDKKGRFCKCP